MGRIITLLTALLMIIGRTGVVLSETVKQNGNNAPAGYFVVDGLSGKRVFVPRGYVAPTGGPPNPNAPGLSLLDPSLHYLGPYDPLPSRGPDREPELDSAKPHVLD
jgi:hypothetical protein